jgi:hypothetical protein
MLSGTGNALQIGNYKLYSVESKEQAWGVIHSDHLLFNVCEAVLKGSVKGWVMNYYFGQKINQSGNILINPFNVSL